MSTARFELPRLHIVTDDSILDRADVADLAVGLLNTLPGRVAVHIRGPRTSGRRVYEIASDVAAGAGTTGLFVNDRVDIARAVGCGVHLGGRSLPTDQARGILGRSAPIGRSVRAAAEVGTADFAFAGSVYETPSHPGQIGRGVEWFSDIASNVSVPIMAIGGINSENIGVLLDAGAYGVATIRSVWRSADPVAAAEQLAKHLTEHLTNGSTRRLERGEIPEPMDE